MKKLITALLLVLCYNAVVAQNHPEDPALKKKATEKFVMASDDIRAKKYRSAANSLHWLMKNVPNYHDGIYINAYKAYEQLGDDEKDAKLKEVYLDSMLICYQLKSDIFELSSREKNNLAYKYFKYFKSDPKKIQAGLDSYKAVYTEPNEVINNNLVSYMYMAAKYKELGFDLSLDQAFEIHDQITGIINTKESQGEDKEKLDRYRDAINGILNGMISEGTEINCGFIEENMAPKMEESLSWAKRVFTMMLDNKCTESTYFIKSAERIWKDEPSEGLAKTLAYSHAKVKDYTLALEWYDQAFRIAESAEEKAIIKMNMANILAVDQQKAKARDAALEAVKLSASNQKEAYEFIGNLYMGSFNDCKKSVSQVVDRAVFMLAYDMYELAGNKEMMASAKAQFPTVSQRFDQNINEGDKISVGCWIQSETTVKTRASN